MRTGPLRKIPVPGSHLKEEEVLLNQVTIYTGCPEGLFTPKTAEDLMHLKYTSLLTF